MVLLTLHDFNGAYLLGDESERVSRSVRFSSVRPRGLQPVRLPWPWDSPGQNTGVSTHSLLRGIFLTQGLNPGLLRCRQILCRVEAPGKPDGGTVCAESSEILF